jgi:hypothetical protein
MDSRGNLYGTTTQGGTGDCRNMNLVGCGTVFELSRQGNGVWNESVLYSFQGVPNGNGDGDAAEPNSLIFDSSGNLFGFASNGGSCTMQVRLAVCVGAAFQLRKRYGAWRESIIYRADATGSPFGALFDLQGNLYSVATFGGPEDVGAVFMLSPPPRKGEWTETTLYAFQNQNDGALPVPGLVFDPEGNLYGASSGSDSVPGNVFELTPGADGAWTESVLFPFNNQLKGLYPSQGPTMDSQGNLFGTTGIGGTGGDGVAYVASQANGVWTEKVLHDFSGGSDGWQPSGGLEIGKDGALFGATLFGGSGACSYGCGTIFRATP